MRRGGYGDGGTGLRSRAGSLLLVLMLAVLGGLWVLGGAFSGAPTPIRSPGPGATVPALVPGSLAGRLVYSTFESDGPVDRQQRLWVLDLASGRLAEGPLVPTAEELTPVGRDRSSILVVSDGARQGGVAYLLEDLSAEAVPVELARGDLVSVPSRADAILVARTEPITDARCPGSRYVISRVAAATGARREVARGDIPCGRLLSVTGVGPHVYASLLRSGRPETGIVSGGRLRTTWPGRVLVSAGPGGAWLTVAADGGVVRPLGVWPGTPTGRLTVSSPPPPSGRPPGPASVRDVELFAERTVAWSRDGRAVVVSGILDDDRSMWLVRVGRGAPTQLLPPNSVPLRSAFSGASFDDTGRLFVGSLGSIVLEAPTGRSLLPLPPGAPTPAGPVAWLP